MQYQWYIARDGKQYGPISSKELAQLEQSGELKQQDYIWRAGFADWRTLSSLSASERNDPQASSPAPTNRQAQQTNEQTGAAQQDKVSQASNQKPQASFQARATSQIPAEQTSGQPHGAQSQKPTGQAEAHIAQPTKPMAQAANQPVAAGAQNQAQAPMHTMGSNQTEPSVKTQPALQTEPLQEQPASPSISNASDGASMSLASEPHKKRSFFKIAAWSLATIVILGVGAIFAAPYLIPQDEIKQQIAKQLSDRTGRKVEIKGKLSFSIFPKLGLDVHNVIIHNPPSIKGDYFARIARAHAKVKLIPLLSKKLDVETLTIYRPEINLIAASKGRNNWKLGALKPFFFTPFKVADLSTSQIAEKLRELENSTPPKTSAKKKPNNANPAPPKKAKKATRVKQPMLAGLTLNQVTIEKGTLSFTNQGDGKTQTLKNLSASVHADSLTSPATIKGTAVYKKKKIVFSSRIDQLQSLLDEKPTTIKANISLPGVNTNVFGKLSIANGIHLTGQLKAKASALHEFANWVSVDLPPQRFKNAGIISKLVYRDKIITLDDATISLDKQQVKGFIRTDLRNAKPYISAKLTTDSLDLTPYLVTSYRVHHTPVFASDGTHTRQSAVAAWSSDRLNFSALSQFNSKVSLKAKTLAYKDIKLNETTLLTNLVNGKLTAHLKKFKAYGGSGTSILVLNSALSTPTLNAKGQFRQIDMKSFLTALNGTQTVSGDGSFTFNLLSKGKTQKALISQLGGDGNLSIHDGEIRGINLAALSNALRKGSISSLGNLSSQVTEFSALKGSYTIQEGVVTNKDLSLTGPELNVTGEGTVDLGQETLNFKVKPDLSGGSATINALNAPLVIKGPWAKPSYGLDLKSALSNPDNVKTITKKAKDVIKKLKKKKISKDDIKDLLDGGGDGAKDLLGQILGGN